MKYLQLLFYSLLLTAITQGLQAQWDYSEDEQKEAEEQVMASAPFWTTLAKIHSASGRTTNHVATIIFDNEGAQEENLNLPAQLIPGNNKYQGFIIPSDYSVNVGPGEKKLLELDGYCTNYFLPAPPTEWELIHPSYWTSADVNNWDSVKDVWKNEPGLNFEPEPYDGALPATIMLPGTNEGLTYTLDFDRYPSTAMPLLHEVIKRLETSFDQRKAQGLINTPYSNDALKERSTVIQHTFWIYTSILQGKVYSLDHFVEKAAKQWNEANRDQQLEQNDLLKADFEKGAGQFWQTFIDLGKAAGLFK